jgi:hypothetical protein
MPKVYWGALKHMQDKHPWTLKRRGKITFSAIQKSLFKTDSKITILIIAGRRKLTQRTRVEKNTWSHCVQICSLKIQELLKTSLWLEVECLPSKYKALTSNSSTAKKEN